MPASVTSMPEKEWPTSTVGPSCRASTRSTAATASGRVVSGFCTAVALSPAACSRPITSVQQEPSANRPCASTTLRALGGAMVAAIPFVDASETAAPAAKAVEKERLVSIMIETPRSTMVNAYASARWPHIHPLVCKPVGIRRLSPHAPCAKQEPGKHGFPGSAGSGKCRGECSAGAQTQSRDASNRNQARCSASSVQVSIMPELALSPASIGQRLRAAQGLDQREVVIAKLGQHRARRHVRRIIVRNRLAPPDIGDRLQRGRRRSCGRARRAASVVAKIWSACSSSSR
jgi:hypothetical protein